MQVHGAIGFSWLHDSHLYLRRALALQSTLGPQSAVAHDIVRLSAGGVRRRATLDAPADADDLRAEARAFRARYEAAADADRTQVFIESGFAFPHWPAPWGRSATAGEQLVIDEELAGLPPVRVHWIALTIAAAGTDDQKARFVSPSMTGEIRWCQLFSEPNAGSDAAGIQTRARRTDAGWLVSGQKLWTTGAESATHGWATVRTNPDAQKHAGISMMVIDMHAPGVTVRPLRDLAGIHRFNEVFLDDVYVPDDDVVGPVDGGWAVARNTLGNERLSIGAEVSPVGADATALLSIVESFPAEHVIETGRLIAVNLALVALNLRRVARAVAGAPPGAEGNVTKLATAEHAQAVHELALVLYGTEAAYVEGPAAGQVAAFLFSRQHTIGGGTSEISRNQIGERILGLPREPGLS
ncbi:MAG: acyl-CoA dehydrogenase family protein [Acidobacteria bacterium]|nr:acyl-CoA dehydrogenase family protein [Acidobacteriota bacterium]